MTANDYGPAQFADEFNVSRETMADLNKYADLLKKWTTKINLISKSTVTSLWDRHFRDSAQVYAETKIQGHHWVDVGSGGGLPGLIAVILAKGDRSVTNFTLVESDLRKTIFLETVVRELSLPVKVLCSRIEELEDLKADIFSARALAPLPTLLGYASQHLNTGGQCLFQKGATYKQEIDHAKASWSFQCQIFPSITDQNAAILQIGEIQRV